MGRHFPDLFLFGRTAASMYFSWPVSGVPEAKVSFLLLTPRGVLVSICV